MGNSAATQEDYSTPFLKSGEDYEIPQSYLCSVCQQATSTANSIGYEGNTYHKRCFKCQDCSKPLSQANVIYDFTGGRIICQECNMKVAMDLRDKTLKYDINDLTPRMKVIVETLETEESYVAYLAILLDGFMKPIQAANRPRINQNPQVSVFVSVTSQILSLNKRFLGDLRERINITSQDIRIGDIFDKYAKMFTIYGQYARSYGMFMDIVNEECLKSSAFEAVLEKCRSNPRNRQSLSSLLIMPVQRVPRYKMLLEQVLKKTKEDAADRGSLIEALREIEITATHVNDAIGARESFVKLMKVIKTFFGNPRLEALDRTFLKVGRLVKISRKGKRQKYVFHLFSDVLTYSESTPVGYKLHQKLPLRGMTVNEEKNNATSFQIEAAKKSIIVYANSEADRDGWILAIDGAIGDLRERMESEEKEKAPVWVRDYTVKACNACGSKFKLLKRRHHCRKCGLILCHACSPHKWLLPHIDKKKALRVCNGCYSDLLNHDQRRRLSRADSILSDETATTFYGSESQSMLFSDRESLMSGSSRGTLRSFDPFEFLEDDADDGNNRLKIAKTILREEREYCEYLRILTVGFTKPLTEEMARRTSTAQRQIAGTIGRSGEVLSIMGSNAEQLYTLSERLKEDLQNNISEATKIADTDLDISAESRASEIGRHINFGAIFEKYFGYFDLHTTFCSHLPAAIRFLTAPEFAKFVNEVQKTENDKLKGATIHYLLDLPSNKITDYIENIQTLLYANDTVLESKDSVSLTRTVEHLKHTNKEMLPSIRDKNLHIMKTLQTQFIGDIDLAKPGRALIHTSLVQKISRKKPIEYRFHLFSDMLTYSVESQTGYYLHRIMDLTTVDVSDHVFRRNAFEIRSSPKSFICVCQNKYDKRIWLKSLTKALAAVNKGRANQFATAPVWTPDKSSSNCALCSSNFTCCVRRHHCRSCGSLICNKCSKNRALLPHVNEKKPVRVCDECAHEAEYHHPAEEPEGQSHSINVIMEGE